MTRLATAAVRRVPLKNRPLRRAGATSSADKVLICSAVGEDSSSTAHEVSAWVLSSSSCSHSTKSLNRKCLLGLNGRRTAMLAQDLDGIAHALKASSIMLLGGGGASAAARTPWDAGGGISFLHGSSSSAMHTHEEEGTARHTRRSQRSSLCGCCPPTQERSLHACTHS